MVRWGGVGSEAAARVVWGRGRLWNTEHGAEALGQHRARVLLEPHIVLIIQKNTSTRDVWSFTRSAVSQDIETRALTDWDVDPGPTPPRPMNTGCDGGDVV